MVYCEKCRSWYRPGTEVCLNCGAELAAPPEPNPAKRASKGLLITGWIFCILGGLIGLFIAIHITSAKIKNANGSFVYKYDDYSRHQGKTMLITCVTVMGLAIILQMFIPPQL